MLKNVLPEDSAAADLSDSNVLVIGGASGVGSATAVALASRGASVTIIGASETRCGAVLDQMRAVSPLNSEASFAFHVIDFHHADAILLTTYLTTYANAHPRLDMLVLSPFTDDSDDPSRRKASLDIVGASYTLVSTLAPLLNSTATHAGIRSRVLVVGDPSAENEETRAVCEGLNWVTLELAAECRDVVFVHVHPGQVRGAVSKAPFVMRVIGNLLGASASVEEVAKRMVFYLTTFASDDSEGSSRNAYLIDDKGNDVSWSSPPSDSPEAIELDAIIRKWTVLPSAASPTPSAAGSFR
ncbi:hypothetical protein BJ742DRAFT_774884 [Cladochytrium replicatum]|nr:hypothetical protein BJ742DRAFT_774884 [Cladochytrium replicatum]